MASIINKLDLNRTPQNCEDYSLVFAQNVKLNKDGILCKDDGISKITLANDLTGFSIVGVIPYNTCFFVLLYNANNGNPISRIIQYNEYDGENTVKEINCAWTYSGGNIDGNVVQTLNGDIILAIAESFDNVENNPLIPLKFININTCSAQDNESIYSQLPEVPFINLELKGTYANPIPNGVYQFFIRYEIYKDCYTEWFPASKECFAGTPQIIDKTQLGTVKYIDTSYQSSDSFVFNVNQITDITINPYKKFQVGFILATDDKVVARSWKLFDINTTTIYFDYDKNYIEELDVADFIRPAFDIYNVKNITMFKNKQYISNYIETDYNPNVLSGSQNITIADISKKVNITLKQQPISNASQRLYVVAEDPDRQFEYKNQIIDVAVENTEDNNSTSKYFVHIINNLFKTQYSEYKHLILADEENIGNKSYTKTSTDYGVYLTASCKESDTKRYTTLNDVEDDIIYGPVLQAIRNKYGNVELKHIVLENPLYVNSSAYIDSWENDIAICNGLRTQPYSYGVVDFSAESEDSDYEDLTGDEDIITIGGYDTITTLGVSHIMNHISSYNKHNDTLYHTVFTRDNQASSTFMPDVVTDDYITPVTKLKLYSIIYLNNKWICKTLTLSFKTTLSEIYTPDSYTNYTTLIPNQEYKFYIHYVKANGETTNGYIINNGDVVVDDSVLGIHNIIYPDFDFNNITQTERQLLKSKGYVAYFISIQHYRKNVVELIDTRYCLELDAKLYYATKANVVAANQQHEYKIPVVYRSSNDNTFITDRNNNKIYRFFGNTGIVDVTLPDNLDWSNFKYIYLDYENDSDDIQLIKATPYYPLDFQEIIDDYKQLNLGGYLCDVYRIEIPTAYADGDLTFDTLFYNADNLYRKYVDGNGVLAFDSLYYSSQLEGSDYNRPTHLAFDLRPSISSHIIYSNFNLNYIGLTHNGMQMIVPQVKQVEDKHPYNGEPSNKLIPWYNFNALQLSSFYHLEQMYKDYARKTYSKYTDEAVIKYDNTIRCSELVGDEEKLYRYTFDITDYYNITPNKGKIVNLYAAGIALIAHTEDSIFKFTGSSSLTNEQGGSIQTAETDLFKSGANEVFGSLYGYGGLQVKRNSLVTEAGYFFYDNHSNTIYVYASDQHLKVLSDSIYKILNVDKVVRVDFASDLKNDRIFVNINFENDKYITLSYNLANGANLISTHTFDYDYTFNTKVNCYFVKNNNVYKIDKSAIGYGALTSASNLLFSDTPKNNNYPSIIDIVYNGQPGIKILDSISWVCEEVSTLASVFKNARATIETKDMTYKGDYLRIYTDNADTENLDLSITSINRFNDVKKPYYDRGSWNLNYFRNVLNLLNTQGLPNKIVNNEYVSDETTLVYGSYIIARFIFDTDKQFKFNNIIFNTSKI